MYSPSKDLFTQRARRQSAGVMLKRRGALLTCCFGAVAQALPRWHLGGEHGTTNNVTMGGIDPRTVQPFAYYDYEAGSGDMSVRNWHGRIGDARSYKQHAQHIGRDSELLADAYPPATACAAAIGGIRMERGIVSEYEILAETALTALSDRRMEEPYEALGSSPRESGVNIAIRDEIEERNPRNVWLTMRPDGRLRIDTSGGGFGSTK